MNNFPKINIKFLIYIFLFLLLVSGSRNAMILFFIFALILLIYYLLKQRNFGNFINGVIIDNPNSAKSNPMPLNFFQNTKKLLITIVIIAVAGWLLIASIVIVEAGQTGVYSLFGRVRDKEVSSGIHLINPLAKVTRMSIRTEEYTMSKLPSEGKKMGDDAIAALTKEGLNVDLDITVLYHLEENRASDVYRDVGLNFEEKIIRPEIRSTIREVIALYDAKDIYAEKREEATGKIYERLKESLNNRGIAIEEVLLRNITLPANLAQAIQEKLQADQEQQKYDFILQKEKKEADRKRIEAAGQRDSQKIINESLTTNYLYYLYVNQLKDRQGTIYVPTSPSTGMPLFKDIGQ